MDTAMKHPVPDRVKPSFVIFDIRHSDAQLWASECLDVKNVKRCFIAVLIWQQWASKG